MTKWLAVATLCMAPLSAATAHIENDATADALAALTDLRVHLDECAGPDDYVIDCTAQALVLDLLDQVIGRLEGM